MNNIQLTTDISRYLPTWYKDILEYQEICQTEAQQLESLAAFIDAVHQNFYFQTMDESAVEQWEQVFRIVANPSTENLAFRQARLLNRMSTRPPYTLGFLYQKLDELIGPGLWTVTVDYPNYTLYIESAASDQSYAQEVAFTVNKIKPAHIVYTNTPLVQIGIVLNETISRAFRTYNYSLGTWQLGVLPFVTDAEAEVIKMPEAPSIQPNLLAGTANFVSGDIASAQVNGSIPISAITKSVDTYTVTVTYVVTEAITTEITAVALLDSDGNVLTNSQVYVPVSGQVVIKHVIPVQEGVLNSGS